MVAMLHARNNYTILFLWDKMFILMQNSLIVPGMQHGRHAKPPLEKKLANHNGQTQLPVFDRTKNTNMMNYESKVNTAQKKKLQPWTNCVGKCIKTSNHDQKPTKTTSCTPIYPFNVGK